LRGGGPDLDSSRRAGKHELEQALVGMINPPVPQAGGSGPRTRLMMRWPRRVVPARGLRDRRTGRWVRRRLWRRDATEADRMRTALLRAVSHDLRSPLAAATAAVSGLRGPGVQLTAADRDELLDTAGESLELLSWLASSLLDLTRLQAGARPVFPRPSDRGEIVTHALAGLGPRARGGARRPPAWGARGDGRPAAHGTRHCQPDQ
jgi:signal transduction histidine kinase